MCKLDEVVCLIDKHAHAPPHEFDRYHETLQRESLNCSTLQSDNMLQRYRIRVLVSIGDSMPPVTRVTILTL